MTFFKLIFSTCASIGLLAMTFPAAAHHGTTAFDLTKSITITGIIKEMDWQNPHVEIYIDSTSTNFEKSVTWVVEARSPY